MNLNGSIARHLRMALFAFIFALSMMPPAPTQEKAKKTELQKVD